jgi:biotin carboxyl carrier protein
MKNFKYTINGKVYNVSIEKKGEIAAEVEVNGVPYNITLVKPKKQKPVTPIQQAQPAPKTPVTKPVSAKGGGTVKAPLPGVILSIDCNVGDSVRRGQKVLVLEAMKMENTISSDRDGVIAEIKVNKGDSVLEGVDLIVFK